MIWTYCNLSVMASPGELMKFEGPHGLPGEPFSLSRLVPVPLLPADGELQETWGCEGLIEVIRPWGHRGHKGTSGGSVSFRCPGAAPTKWFRKAIPALGFQEAHVDLRYATEATGIHGSLLWSLQPPRLPIWHTSETEGDLETVESLIRMYGSPGLPKHAW